MVFLAVMVLGTLGFMFVEKIPLTDALYFSIVTIATVGYGDIHPATQAGKVLAIFMIVLGVGTFLGVVANATEMQDVQCAQEAVAIIVRTCHSFSLTAQAGRAGLLAIVIARKCSIIMRYSQDATCWPKPEGWLQFLYPLSTRLSNHED